jgi:SAM-dependent methyltransferase
LNLSLIMDFDRFAETYEQEVAAATRFAGASSSLFLEVKVGHVLTRLRQRFESLGSVRLVDIGCGIGRADQLLKVHLPNLVGVDVSDRSLQAARARNPELRYLRSIDGALPFPDGTFDVALAMCVWHHVPPHQWTKFLSEISRVLTARGILLVYEHNPWNPLTRFAVSRCAFDEDAVLLSANKAAQNIHRAGFANIVTDYLLFLPFESRMIRFCERTILRGIPLGAQYALSATRK